MSADLPRISVVTICRNALPALRRTADSVLGQAYQALEYWVVDGASTDGTRDYLEELAARGARVLSEPDRGISDAMNKGVRLATGTWVAHLHAGDLYLPGALDAVARRILERPDADVVCAPMVKQEEHGTVIYGAAPERLPWDMAINHPATWTRRALFERHGGFDLRYRLAMDYDFFLRLERAGCRFEVLPAPLAAMEHGGASEQSLWVTLSECHAVRRERLSGGWQRSGLYLALLWLRGAARRLLQRVGLGGLVAWARARLSILAKREVEPPAR